MKNLFYILARILEWISGQLWFTDSYRGILRWISFYSYEWMLKLEDVLREKYKFEYDYKFI